MHPPIRIVCVVAVGADQTANPIKSQTTSNNPVIADAIAIVAVDVVDVLQFAREREVISRHRPPPTWRIRTTQ